MAEDEHIKMLDYRLDNIEKTLSEMKDVIIENRLQQKDIEELKRLYEETVKALNAHDQRIRELELANADLSVEHVRKKAERWENIVNMILKALAGAVIAMVLVKIGLQ